MPTPNTDNPAALLLAGQSPAVATLLTELATNPLGTLEWLDGHLTKVIDEAIQKELDAAIPPGLPPAMDADVESGLLFRMMVNTGIGIGSFSTNQTHNLMQAIRFRCILQRFRDTARCRQYNSDALATADAAMAYLRDHPEQPA